MEPQLPGVLIMRRAAAEPAPHGDVARQGVNRLASVVGWVDEKMGGTWAVMVALQIICQLTNTNLRIAAGPTLLWDDPRAGPGGNYS